MLTKKIQIASVILAIIVIAAVAGTYYYYTTLSVAPQVIKIGDPLPLTGYVAPDGWTQKMGAELAAKQVNDEGGLLVAGKRYRVEVVFGDCEGKVEAAVSAVEKLVTLDKVDFIVGGWSSPESLAWIDIAQRNKVPTILTTAGSRTIPAKIASEEMNYIFQLSPTTLETGNAAAECMLYYLGKPLRWANLMEDIEAHHDVAKCIGDQIGELSPDSVNVYSEFYPSGSTDFYSEIQKLITIKPDILYVTHVGTAAPAFVEQAIELGLDKVTNIFGVFGEPVLADFVDKYGLDYWITCIRFQPVVATQPFLEAYKAYTGMEPPAHTPYQQYDGMIVLFDAIQRAGTFTDPDAVVTALEETSLDGIRGFKMTFRPLEQGHNMPTTVFEAQVQTVNGTRARYLIWPSEYAQVEFKPMVP